MKKIKKIVDIIITIILITIILMLLTIIILKKENNNIHIGNYYVFKVATGSMEPTLKVNDIILVKKSEEYKINDIITYKENNKYITHRLIRKEDKGYITKGDNNQTEDKEIREERIIGKVIKNLKIIRIIYELIINPFVIILVIFIVIIKKVIFRKENEDVK